MTRWLRQWVVKSESNPDKEYIVSEGEDGEWGCGCPGWVKHAPRRDCKHILWVREGHGGTTMTEAVINKLAGY